MVSVALVPAAFTQLLRLYQVSAAISPVEPVHVVTVAVEFCVVTSVHLFTPPFVAKSYSANTPSTGRALLVGSVNPQASLYCVFASLRLWIFQRHTTHRGTVPKTTLFACVDIRMPSVAVVPVVMDIVLRRTVSALLKPHALVPEAAPVKCVPVAAQLVGYSVVPPPSNSSSHDSASSGSPARPICHVEPLQSS